jgi:hypothetical protein
LKNTFRYETTADALRTELADSKAAKRIHLENGNHRGIVDQLNQKGSISLGEGLCWQGIRTQRCGIVLAKARRASGESLLFGEVKLRRQICLGARNRENEWVQAKEGDSGAPVYDKRADGGAAAAGIMSYTTSLPSRIEGFPAVPVSCFSWIANVTEELNANLAIRGRN